MRRVALGNDEGLRAGASRDTSVIPSRKIPRHYCPAFKRSMPAHRSGAQYDRDTTGWLTSRPRGHLPQTPSPDQAPLVPTQAQWHGKGAGRGRGPKPLGPHQPMVCRGHEDKGVNSEHDGTLQHQGCGVLVIPRQR